MYVRMHIRTYVCTYAYVHTYIRTYIHTYTHTHTHTHVHIINTYTNTYVLVQHRLGQHGNLLLNISQHSNGLYHMPHGEALLHPTCTHTHRYVHT